MNLTICIFAGGYQPSIAESAVGVPLASILIKRSLNLLDAWSGTISSAGIAQPIHLLISNAGSDPARRNHTCRDRLVSVLDARPHRGTAGVLADFHDRMDNGDRSSSDGILAIDLSAFPCTDLRPLLAAAVPEKVGLAFGMSSRRVPAGVAIVKREVLDKIPNVGYIDLKEQAVGICKQNGMKIVAETVSDRAFWINSRSSWLSCVRRCANWRFHGEVDSPGASEIERSFRGNCCVDPSATILGESVLLDSVVMEGVKIQANAIIARSIIGPGCRIGEGARVIDAIVRA